MAFTSRWVEPDTSVPVGRYWRNRPWVVSLVPRCQGWDGSATTIWIASRWASRACSALSVPRSSVKVLRSRAGTCRSVVVKPARARLASVPSLLARLTTRVVRATRVPTAAPLRAPLMRSPSPWPGTGRVATAADRPAGPRPTRLAQRHQQCAPQGSAWQHIQADREGLSRQVVAPVVRIRAGEPPGTLFGRAPLGQMRPHRRPQPEIQECARAVAGAPDRLPTCVPCTRETGGPVPRCGRIPGARCWALAAPPSPAPAANGQGPGPDAAAHGRRHASA